MEWKQVLFIDECRFCLGDPDRHAWVWRCSRQWYNQEIFIAKWITGVALWWSGSGISSKTRIELHVCNKGSVTARFYIWDALPEHLGPYSPFLWNGLILQQDDARLHVVCETQILGSYGNCTNRLASVQPGLKSNRTCLAHDGKIDSGSQFPNKFAGVDLRNTLQEI